jgi:Ca2+-binding RTX toxin-like protein
MPRLLFVACLSAAAVVVATTAAQAGTVSVSATSANLITFVANAGEANALEILIFSPPLITDSGAELTAGPGCVAVGSNSANCGPIRDVNASLHDRNDTAHIQAAGVITIWAGSGDDSVIADSFGRTAAVYGEAGNDKVSAAGEVGQIADGGPGNDIVNVFAFGGDSSGFGGPGNDTITYGNTGNPGIGPVALDGGSGDDTILARPTFTGGTVSGGSGNDVIAPDLPAGFPLLTGPYTISGDAGDDVITGEPGNDTVDGGTGADYIDVRGGGADTVTCGAGVDVVLYDASDTVSGDCEHASISP